MTTIHVVLNERCGASRSQREIGDRFERVVAQCLRSDPEYANQFNDVRMWMERKETLVLFSKDAHFSVGA